VSKILACLSGGVESTYGVYDLLKNTDHDVTLFHLYFRNHPRYEGETEACEHIVNWLEKNTREFGWKSANISYSGVDEITQPPYSADCFYINSIVANIVIDEKDYDEVRFFMNKEEYDIGKSFDYPKTVEIYDIALSRFPEIKTKWVLDKNTIELTKKDIYNRTPTDLRRYIYSNDKNYNGVIK